MSDCTKAIRTALGDETISDAQAANLLQRMENLARARAAENGLRIDQAIKEIAGELRAGEESMRLIDRRNRLLSTAAMRQKLETIMNGDKLWAKSLNDALALTNDHFRAFEHRFQAPFDAKLKELGLSDVFRKGQYSKEFFLEAWNAGAGGKTPVTPGEMGKKIHDLMMFYVEQRRQRNALLNRAGAYYPEHENYGFLQSYSQQRLHALGGKMDDGHKSRTRSAFFNLVATVNIDPRTYQGRDPAKFWSNVFDNLYADTHIDEAPDRVKVDRFTDVHGSLANKLSQRRLIWFADAESQWMWNQAIGAGGHNELMMREMTHAARSLALMTDWGPNWRNTVNLVNDHLRALAVDRNDSAKQEAALKGFGLEGRLRILSGEADIPRRPTLAKWTRNAITFFHTAKMGAATIASYGDVVSVYTTLGRNGMGALDRFGRQMTMNTPREVLEGVHVVSNSLAGSLQNRFGVGEVSGGLARASHALFQLNFFNRWNDMNQEVTASSLSWWLGRNADLPHEKLPEGLQTQLAGAGIKAGEWEALRKTARTVSSEAGEHLDPGNMRFVLADQLDQIADADIDAIISSRGLTVNAANRTRVRDDLDLKLSTYFTQQVDAALNVPNLETRYVTTLGGQQAGTFPRAVADFGMIFKSFPISVALRMKKRVEDAGLLKGAWGDKQWSLFWNQAQLIAFSGVAGYMSMLTRDLLNGRTPRALIDENGVPNASVWLSALAKGGGLGIMGDFLFSEYDRQYKSALSTLAGPAFGLVDPLGALYTGTKRLMSGEEVKEKPLSEAFQLATNNLPFANLFYIKPILNAFIFWNVREALSPGVLRRSEKSAREMNYQDFLIEPSEIADIPITEPGRKLEAMFN